ncbi:MAG: ribonuclease III [Phycisphaerales bacterium]
MKLSRSADAAHAPSTTGDAPEDHRSSSPPTAEPTPVEASLISDSHRRSDQSSAASPTPSASSGSEQFDPEIIARAEAILNHTFKDRSLLERALTHASIATTRHRSNERLEFLGDAVLGLLTCDYLYENYPDLLEGDMTKIKSDAVSRKKCARIAHRLRLDELLLIGKGMQTRSTLPPSLSAAVVESLLGALYIEAGIERVREFLLPHLAPMIDEIAASGHHQNFKSVLQQHAQQVLGAQPVYMLMEERGPDHDKLFLVAVELNGSTHEACWSRSKKQAEQAAAQRALIALGVLVESESGSLVCSPNAMSRADSDVLAGGAETDPDPDADSDADAIG